MRCSSCGFPLSPSRKSCSRCGAAVIDKAEKSKNAAEGTQAPPPNGFGFQGGQAYLEPAQPQWGQAASSSTWGVNTPMAGGQSASSPFYQAEEGSHEQLDFSSANAPTLADQLPFPGNPASFPPSVSMAEPEARQPFRLSETPISPTPPAHTPLPLAGWTPNAPPRHATNLPTGPGPLLHPLNSSFLASKLTPRFGFTISGAFIITGMLLLVFVFLISLSLPLSSISSSRSAAPTVTANAQNTPTAANGAASPEATTNPTATAGTLPAKQFIDNAQTASAVNPSTATATRVTASFKAHQPIYVTFAVHASQSGTVCLLWFLNEKQFDSYQFAIDGMSTSAYSYTTANAPGTGYVQIYWASKPGCADKTLAQQANFTVTA